MTRLWLWAATVLALSEACGGAVQQADVSTGGANAGVTDAAMAAVAGRRIFFGHQSVGANIVQGLEDLAADQAVPALRVVGLDQGAGLSGGFFAHKTIGRNGRPGAKTDEFAALLDGGLAGRVDIAFHKYCYVDLPDGADVGTIFAHYRDTMARLRREYPAVTFVHVTVPLTAAEPGLKWLAKRLLGRRPDNYGRQRFNELMRREYAGKEPLFDLAAAESSGADGRKEGTWLDGRLVESLRADYTDDGGHLNGVGRRQVAAALLQTLAGLVPTW